MNATVVLLVATLGLAPAAVEAVPARRLLELTDLGNPVISPDGRHVAFRSEQASVERNVYDTTWYVQRLEPGSLPRRISDGGEPLREHVTGLVSPSPAIWSPDGRWLYYRARFDGTTAVWRAAADGSGAAPVTVDAADVRDFSLDDDGGTLRYSVGATREAVAAAEMREYEGGVRIDDTSVLTSGLFRSSRIDGRPATQKFLGDWFDIGPLLADTPDRWKAVDLATMITAGAAAAPVASRPTLDDIRGIVPDASKAVVRAEDGRTAIVAPATGGHAGLAANPFSRLLVLDAGGRSVAAHCEDHRCRGRAIGDLRWRPGTDEVLFTAIDHRRGRAHEIHAWNTATGQVRTIVTSDGLVSGSQRHWDVPCAASAATLVCVAAEADRPPRLEAIDLDHGRREVLFEPNKALEADIATSAPARMIRWTDREGREFVGQLFEARRAAAGEPSPLFVTFYTCQGFLRGGFGDEWPLVTLAVHGISALCINAPPGYALDFERRHDQGRSALESVVAVLAAEGRVDPARVGMGGLSYGSDVVLWTIARSDLVAAASISSISVTPNYYLYNSLRETFRTQLERHWQLGSIEETPERWKQVSPKYMLGTMRAPILFQVPEQEYRMLLEYGLPLIRRHQADLLVFPEEAHIKYQPRHKLSVYERNLDWFRFWLQRHEDTGPEKAERYRVWRNMRARIAPAGAAPSGKRD